MKIMSVSLLMDFLLYPYYMEYEGHYGVLDAHHPDWHDYLGAESSVSVSGSGAGWHSGLTGEA